MLREALTSVPAACSSKLEFLLSNLSLGVFLYSERDVMLAVHIVVRRRGSKTLSQDHSHRLRRTGNINPTNKVVAAASEHRGSGPRSPTPHVMTCKLQILVRYGMHGRIDTSETWHPGNSLSHCCCRASALALFPAASTTQIKPSSHQHAAKESSKRRASSQSCKQEAKSSITETNRRSHKGRSQTRRARRCREPNQLQR